MVNIYMRASAFISSWNPTNPQKGDFIKRCNPWRWEGVGEGILVAEQSLEAGGRWTSGRWLSTLEMGLCKPAVWKEVGTNPVSSFSLEDSGIDGPSASGSRGEEERLWLKAGARSTGKLRWQLPALGSQAVAPPLAEQEAGGLHVCALLKKNGILFGGLPSRVENAIKLALKLVVVHVGHICI